MDDKKRIEIIKKAFEQIGLIASPYEVGGKVVGWETEGWTNAGGDMLIFIDMCDNGLNALNFNDVIDKTCSTINDIDIDEEIDINMQGAKKWGLSTRETVEDISNYYENLQNKVENFYVGFLNNEIKPYLNVELAEDYSTDTGGLSYSNEKLDNFLLEAEILNDPDYDPTTYGLKELNKDLKDCGIAPIKTTAIQPNFSKTESCDAPCNASKPMGQEK